MFKEKISVIISILLLSLLFSLNDLSSIPKYLAIFALLILSSVAVKKIAGYYMEIDTSVEIWEFERYWFAERSKFRKPLPIGLILPVILYLFSYQTLTWLATLQTDFKARKTKQISKKKNISTPGVKEIEIAIILFASLLSSIIIAIVMFQFSKDLANICLLYALYSLIPIGKLDGTKLIFSSRIVYFLSLLVLAGTAVILGILQL